MRLEELLWDDDNEAHIARHHVTPEEVEEAVFDRSARPFRTRSPESQLRYIFLGQSEAGRYLFVVLELLRRGIGRVVTAREMTDSEKQRYKGR